VVTVTGVQVIRGGGEAGTVIVRGLGGVVTLLNGREIFSDAGRSLYPAGIPATMLQRIDVSKTQGGDLPGGGTASVIDVRTSRPFLLWADADADVLDPASWTKSPEPVLRACY
jgi:iron complex outermembrane receptor protein